MYIDYGDDIRQNTRVVIESGRQALFLNGGCHPPFFLSADQIPDRQFRAKLVKPYARNGAGTATTGARN